VRGKRRTKRVPAADGSTATEPSTLAGKNRDDLPAERLGAISSDGKADAIVFHGQLDPSGASLVEDHRDGADAVSGESVLECIGQQLIEDQGVGNGAVDGEFHGVL
jgi:hypothetical protein